MYSVLFEIAKENEKNRLKERITQNKTIDRITRIYFTFFKFRTKQTFKNNTEKKKTKYIRLINVA
jgi:hypothetical protein